MKNLYLAISHYTACEGQEALDQTDLSVLRKVFSIPPS